MIKRKTPLRKCTACNEMKDKRQLVRIVKYEEQYQLDFTGKKPGRGAYICPTIECLEKAQKQKGLERSFKSQVPSEVYESLKSELIKVNG